MGQLLLSCSKGATRGNMLANLACGAVTDGRELPNRTAVIVPSPA